MDWKVFLVNGLKAAGGISVFNLIILAIMILLGYGAYPVDPDMGEMSVTAFVMGTIVAGGIFPGFIGSLLFIKVNQKWQDKSLLIFGIVAMGIATFMTLPMTNPNPQTGDAFILTTLLHYTTAALGIYFIPKFALQTSVEE